jgi:DNA-3-methyladenine glycosylase II
LSTRSFTLRPAPPFRLDLTVWALRRRAQNAIDRWDGRRYRRALLLDGMPFELSVAQAAPAGAPRLAVSLRGPRLSPAAEDAARSALTRLLGLDVDLSGFYARAACDPALRDLADRYRGVKPPRFPTVFECLLNAVACQQLSLAAGLTVLSRLAATAGRTTGALYAFPEPEDVAGLSRSALQALGFSARKAETIHELAEAAMAGELRLEALEPLDDAAVVDALVRRRGIGRWSADYVLLRCLGRLHVFPQSDVGALNGLRSYLAAAGRGDDPRSALTRWAPDAGLVYFHLLLRGLEQRAARSGSPHALWTASGRSRAGAHDTEALFDVRFAG